jgi:hypothetical protein
VLSRQLRHRVRRAGHERRGLGRRELLGAAVDRRRGSADDATGAGVARRDEDGERATDVGPVGIEGLLDGPEHGSMGGEMEDDLAACDRTRHGRRVGDLAFDQGGGGMEVLREAGGEVVEHHHVGARLDQRVDEVRADEPGAACDQSPHE